MKTLLVIAEHPGLAEAVRAAVGPSSFRVSHRTQAAEAEPFLVHGLADACILDLELTRIQGLWALEKVRAWAPSCPVIVYTGPGPQEWEEEAYVKGAAHVFAKPVRPRMLNALLERLLSRESVTSDTGAASPHSSATAFAPGFDTQQLASVAPPGMSATAHALSVLRDFSGILTHSLSAEGMLKEFLLLLREILGVNRAAIFLLQGEAGAPAAAGAERPRLRAISALGISTGLLQHFELSLDAGIGGQLRRSGRILRRQSSEARGDIEAQKEFELLGAQVAIPVLDRETVIGVAVFDGRITGEPLFNAELELVFHLLEQVGLAVRNTWLHEQLSGNHKMLGEILRELSSACILVGSDLSILHANKIARRNFSGEGRSGELEFSDLPQILGTRVYQVLKNGAGISNLRYEPEASPGTIFRVNIVPFHPESGGLPSSALLIAEDISHSEHLRALEVENASLRLVRTMADRLVSEIANAVVPISTHQQLLNERWKDAEFRASLDGALAEGVKRVTRLTDQLRFLAREARDPEAAESIPLAPLLEDAYQEACRHPSVKGASKLRYEAPLKSVVLKGDRLALKHAFAEVMLNALQANKDDPKVNVRLKGQSNGEAPQRLQIEVEDNGSGFTPDAAQNGTKAFFTLRTPGVGLGLTVTQKIIENHRGKLELVPSGTGLVRISLPVAALPAQGLENSGPV